MQTSRVSLLCLTIGLAGCMLHPDVSVVPLTLLPTDIERASDVSDMLIHGEFAKGSLLAPAIDARPHPSVRDLFALGRCELASGRLDAARHHLREALDLGPSRATGAEISWRLSETEYLAKNFAAAEDWAKRASEDGLRVKQWHIELLGALRDVNVNQVIGTASSQVSMAFGKPDIPRINVSVNGESTLAVVDTGAVMSIVSESLAENLHVDRFGTFQGEFLGLLGEPIPVTFGLVKSLRIGSIDVKNVPVAIMPDRNLSFIVFNRQPFKMGFLIGASVLREFRLAFDFQSSEITFTPLQAADRVPAADQNLFFSDFRPVVHGTLNRHGWYLFIVDTGSEITFLNQQALDKSHISEAPRGGHTATLQGLGGSSKQGEKIEHVELGIAQWAGTFKDIPLYGTEQARAMGIIGQNFMEKFQVTIDFGTMRMDLVRQ